MLAEDVSARPKAAARRTVDDAAAALIEHKRVLHELRNAGRAPSFDSTDSQALVDRFLESLGRPTLLALSPAYPQGSRLDEVATSAMLAFRDELEVMATR